MPPVAATAAGFTMLSLCYAGLVRLFAFAPVQAGAWVVLYAACLTLALAMWTGFAAQWSARRWALLAFYAAFLAMYIFSANMGLDVLYGVRRRRSYPEDYLGGIELWFALFPGLFAVAMGGLARTLWLRREPARPATPSSPPSRPVSSGPAHDIEQGA